MRKQNRQRQERGSRLCGAGRVSRWTRRSLGARLPRRIVAPFLLFWCLGSLVLGHELASLPLTTFAAAVTRPLQSLQSALQAQPVRSPVEAAPARRPPQTAAGVLGREPPASPHIAAGKARVKVKGNARTSRTSYRSSAPADSSDAWSTAWGDWPAPDDDGFFDGAPPWYAASGYGAAGYDAPAAAADWGARPGWMAGAFGGGCARGTCDWMMVQSYWGW